MGIINKFLLSEEPDSWFYRFAGAGPSKTGINVNEHSAMKMTAVFASIRILSETLASMPIITYRERDPGNKKSGKDRVTDFHLYDVLKNAPNKEMPAFNFKETLMSHGVSSGNCYSHITRSRRGEVLSLEILPWTETDVQRNQTNYNLEYWTNDRGKRIRLPPEEVFHVPSLGWDGIRGYSPIRMAMEAIGLGLAAEQFGAEFFGSGYHMSGIITYPGSLKGEKLKEYRENLKETYSGLGKSHKILTLEDGSKFDKVSIPLEEAQFIETRRFQIEEIARLYRIPPHMLQDLERSTNNNIEQQSLEFVMYTMLPWFTRWEQMINFRLLTKEERRQGFHAEFLLLALLRGDSKARAQMLHLMRQDGVVSADEWREFENMNPQEGNCGSTYFINGNMLPTDIAAAQQPRQPKINMEGGE